MIGTSEAMALVRSDFSMSGYVYVLYPSRVLILGNTVGDGSGQVSRGDEYFHSEVIRHALK